MEILFCDECGMRFSGEAAPAATQPGGEQKKLCEACRAKLRAAKPSNRLLQPATRGRSERSIPPAQHAAAACRPPAHSTDTARIRGGQPSGNSTIVVGVFLVILLGGGAFFLLRSDTPERTTPLPAETPASPSTPPARTQTTTGTASAAASPSTPSGQEKDAARLAEDAFTKLQSFDGLAPDDREGRIRRIKEFLVRHGNEIVASRARVMLRELGAPPVTTPPAETKAETPATNPEPQAQPFNDGWRAILGPIDFEDGQVGDWRPDSSGPLDVGSFEERKCLRVRPGTDLRCRVYRPMRMDGAGLRVRFRYFVHDMDFVELLWSQGQHRPRKYIEPFTRDGWAEACFTAAELGGKADKLGHIEIGGNAKSANGFLLIDDVVVERQ